MSSTQIIPFDAAKGGNVPDMCLANVIAGFGIPPKYLTAWQAWENTQQHTDRPPLGFAIPVFYSYTTTIDGVTENYGHINVQLPNGTVWSDGNIYASIDDYMSQKFPRFVGWGESVNDFKVIEEEIAVGVTINGSPCSVGTPETRIDVFARGSDNNLYQKYFDNTGWHNWVRVGSGIASDPSVPGPYENNRIDVFFTGGAGDLVHTYFNGKEWTPNESLGQPE